MAVLPDSEDNQQENFFNQLEQAYRQTVVSQAEWVDNHPRPLPDVDHKLYRLKTKAIWHGSIQLQRFNRNRRLVFLFTSPILLLIILFSLYSVLLPKTINYSFSGQSSCSVSPLFLPGLFGSSSKTFSLSRTKTSIFGLDIFSSSVCAKPKLSPKENASYADKEWLNIFGIHLSKTVRIKTSGYPQASYSLATISKLPLLKPFTFTLNSQDHTFSYALSANNEMAPCSKKGSIISCSLNNLKLSYDTSYAVSLVRIFGGHEVGIVLTKDIHTITATGITQTSIAGGSTVYDKPNQLNITLSKPLTKIEGISLTYKNSSGAETTVPITTSFKANQLFVNWKTELPRQTTFDLHISNVYASDDSALEAPYDLTFTTSGGPSVSFSNIPSFGLNSGQAMVLSFNQALDPSQDFGSLISLSVNGQTAGSTVRLSGDHQIIVTPASGYPVCAVVKVVIASSVSSPYGISGNSAAIITSRSHCYTTYSIGTSVQGRPITAYQFGSGSSMVLFIAAMEGNEQNSANLLSQWIPNIDANPGKIPSYRTVVVIPQINPDGYAADTRLNAAGTDLNRNFPANNWSENVTEPLAGNIWTNEGGPYPLSAPEAQALASFYETHRPRLAITEHSHGGIVEANDAGDSIALGAQYARLADYRAIPTYAIGNFFAYTTTGAFEDWANDKLGLPVLEVELQSPTSDEYSRNLPALWAMVQVSP